MRGIVEIVDGAIVHVSCNRAAAKMYGLDRESILGKSATAAGVGDEIAQTWVGLYEKSRSSGEPVSMEYARRDADGQERWLLATASYLGNGHSGNPRFGYSIFDLTEQKRAEEKVRQSEEQYRTLFDALREGFCIIEVIFEADVPVDYRFLEINPAFEKQTGMVNVRGRLMHELAPDHESHWNEIYGQVALTGQPVRFVSESNLLNRWFDVSAYRIGGPGSRKVAILFNDITEARRAEEAVRENRAMLHAALASMADAVFISDAGGRFIEINDAFATFHRFKSKEECAKTFAEYPDLLDVFLPDGTIAPVDMWAVPRALRGEVATNAEYTLRRKDSGETWVGSYSFGPIRDNDGAIAGSVVVARDITERKRAELAAREWSRAFEQAEIGIALVNPHLETYTAVNATFARERGYLPEELIGQPIALVHPPERLEWLKKTVERATSGFGHAAFESVHVRKDGSRFPVFIDLTGVRDQDGRLVSRVVISQDLTERKRAEQERQRSEALYQAIVRNLPGTGLFVVDTDMRYIAVEGGLPPRLGFPREALLGRAVSDVAEASEALVSGERFRQTLDGGTPSAEGEFQGCAIWTRFVPLRDGSGGVFAALALSTDITERKRAEEQIRQLNEDLEGRVRRRTGELETANHELEAFSYSVSHDLRAPLRGIDGWSMALLEDYGQSLDETARRYLARVRSETQRMGLLIDDMLQLSRVTRSEMKREEVDLSVLAHGVAAHLLEDNPGRRIEFRIEDGLRVRGDMRLLEVALTNLLNNAVKFTGPRAEARIEFGLTEAAGEPAYFVRDNGVGFNMAYASSLFGAFQRLHKASEFPGTGIGLATVQRVVRRHGGRVWAEAVAGSGATFYFTVGEEEK
jgi:PAS domain S-box-containing protein